MLWDSRCGPAGLLVCFFLTPTLPLSQVNSLVSENDESLSGFDHFVKCCTALEQLTDEHDEISKMWSLCHGWLNPNDVPCQLLYWVSNQVWSGVKGLAQCSWLMTFYQGHLELRNQTVEQLKCWLRFCGCRLQPWLSRRLSHRTTFGSRCHQVLCAMTTFLAWSWQHKCSQRSWAELKSFYVFHGFFVWLHVLTPITR